MILLGVVFGEDIIRNLFHITDPVMLHNAQMYLKIEMIMIPVYSFQIASMSIFFATNEIVRSNIAAILENFITFFPTLGVMIGVTYASHNIW
jgi:Na+-driven multidrug efflux pump